MISISYYDKQRKERERCKCRRFASSEDVPSHPGPTHLSKAGHVPRSRAQRADEAEDKQQKKTAVR